VARRPSSTTDYLAVPSATAASARINNVGSWSVGAWVYALSQMATGPNPILTSGTTAGSDVPICLGVSYTGSNLTPAGRYFTGFYDNGANDWDYAIDSVAHEVGRWTHLVGTHEDGVILRLFKDGKPVSTGAVAGYSAADTSFRLGRRWNNTAVLAFFDGLVEEAFVYGAALTGDEVLRLYQGESPLNVRPQRLNGYWPMTRGRNELDLSSNQAHMLEVAGLVPVEPGLSLLRPVDRVVAEQASVAPIRVRGGVLQFPFVSGE
jgi:hypothetical protein